MVQAKWNGQLIAESNNTVEIEGNHYFPMSSVNNKFLKPTKHHSTCPWKGEASYYTLHVDGQDNENAAWYYSQPKEAAKEIKDHIAFWKGVKVTRK